ncbi:hypothetical protein GWK47_011594 [Chionoecetes opilio]|uniref:Uncharacterized protein n=1 Tax=Chionoecetes opilio TaxID=41210 RepID=A0A8J4Y1U2_CHIOP|nr:hypothetical protein GWK47_011594 [Chionoecetes opilio]
MRRTSGWGYQSSDEAGMVSGGWSGGKRRLHINVNGCWSLFSSADDRTRSQKGALSASRLRTWARSTVSPAKGHSDPPLLLFPFGADLGMAALFHFICLPGPAGSENVGRRPVTASGSSVEWQLPRTLFSALWSAVGGTPGGGPLRVPPLLPTTGLLTRGYRTACGRPGRTH